MYNEKKQIRKNLESKEKKIKLKIEFSFYNFTNYVKDSLKFRTNLSPKK